MHGESEKWISGNGVSFELETALEKAVSINVKTVVKNCRKAFFIKSVNAS